MKFKMMARESRAVPVMFSQFLDVRVRRAMSMRHKVVVYVWVLLVCGALAGRAQVTTGTISGTVSDSTGAVMPGVTVAIQNEDTGITRTSA